MSSILINRRRYRVGELKSIMRELKDAIVKNEIEDRGQE